MVDEGEGALEVLQARLLESESMARHFESLAQERDHQLNQANRVSSRGVSVPMRLLRRPWGHYAVFGHKFHFPCTQAMELKTLVVVEGTD